MANLFQEIVSYPSKWQSNTILSSNKDKKTSDSSNLMQNINGLTDYINNLISREDLVKKHLFKKPSSQDDELVTFKAMGSKNNVYQYVPLIENTNLPLEKVESDPIPFPKDPMVQIYFAGLAALGIYVLTKLLKNK